MVRPGRLRKNADRHSPPRPPTPCEAARGVAEDLSAMSLRILASQSAERG